MANHLSLINHINDSSMESAVSQPSNCVNEMNETNGINIDMKWLSHMKWLSELSQLSQLSQLSPKVDHKCTQMACNEAKQHMKTITQMVSNISQLNGYYLNRINKCKCNQNNHTIHSIEEHQQLKQQLLQFITINESIINENLIKITKSEDVINNNNNNNININRICLRKRTVRKYYNEPNDEPIDEPNEETLPQLTNRNMNSSKKSCHFCGKKFWSSVLKTHLSKHLNDKQKCDKSNKSNSCAQSVSPTNCEANQFSCHYKDCGLAFNNASQLSSHLSLCDHRLGNCNNNNNNNNNNDNSHNSLMTEFMEKIEIKSETIDRELEQTYAEDVNLEDNYMSSDEEWNMITTNKACHESDNEMTQMVANADEEREEHNTNNNKRNVKGVVCSECGKRLSSQNSLRIHMRLHSGVKPFKCDLIGCDMSFTLKSQLETHQFRCHSIGRPLKCDLNGCDFETNSKYWLKRHRMRKHNLKTNDNNHCKDQKEQFICSWPACQRQYTTKFRLNEHLRSHTGQYKYTCNWPGCEQQFSQRYRLTVHMRVHTGERPYHCLWPGCDKKFRNSGCLNVHMIIHDRTLKRKYVCDYPDCDKSFDTQTLLQQHVFASHLKEKPFKCSLESCSSKFSSKKNMEKHFQSKHVLKGDKKFICDKSDCNRTFVEKESLEKHIFKMHDSKKDRVRKKRIRKLVPKYKCDWPGCEHMALFPRALSIHRMRHTGERPIKCDWPNCQFSTVRKYQLDNHMLKHTGETPFPCEFPNCGRRFKSQRALDTHSDKNHSNRA